MNPVSVVLPADLGIEHSRALHEQLSGHLEVPAVALSAPEINRIHTAALQVLCAFVRTRAAAGRATTWSPPPAALTDAAAKLGVESLLGLAPAPP